MAGIKYLVDLDLTKNQLLNVVVQNLAVAPSNPKDGQIYWDTADKTLYAWKEFFPVPATAPFGIWLDLGTTGVTDLAYTSSDTNGIVTSSAGTDATIPLATLVAGTNKAGLLSPAEKTKIALAVLTNQTDLTASFLSTSESFVENSDTKLASQKATKSYIDNLVLTNGSLVFKDAYNADTNSPNLDSTPIAGIKKGWTYVVSVAGTFYDEPVDAGDMVIAKQNDPTTLSHWALINKNIPEVLTTVLVGFIVGANSTITSADSILVAFGKVQAQLNNKIAGSGTTNKLAKFTGSGAVGNSSIFDDGNVGINQTSPIEKLDVVGNGKFSGTVTAGSDISANGLTVGRGGGNISSNTANGVNTLLSNTTGVNNTANGSSALFNNTTGNNNTANGVNTLLSNTTGVNNTANGANALFNNTTGNNNTVNGTSAGRFIGDGSNATILNNSVFLGVESKPLSNSQTNQIVIGHTAIGAGSNTVTLGNTAITQTILRGTVTASNGTLATHLVTKEQLDAKTGKLVSISASASLVSTFAIAHTFGTDVIANARFVSDNTVFLCEVIMTNNLVTFNVNTPIAANSVKFIIIG
jgi:hypothetical protein